MNSQLKMLQNQNFFKNGKKKMNNKKGKDIQK